MRLYIGTSSARAELLLTLGWTKPIPVLARDAAVRQANAHALTDGGDPVLLAVPDRFHRREQTDVQAMVSSGDLVPECIAEGRTRDETLGLVEGTIEAAGLADVINGILSALNESHKALQNVLDVGQGGNAQVPTIEELRDAYRMVRGDIGQRLDRIRAAYRKGLRRLKRAVAPVKQAQQQANPKTGPRKAPKAPTPKAPKAPRASKSGKAPRPVRKVASRDITISGKINGRNATTTISRGQKYRVERQGNDVHLVMPGLFGKFIVNPGDVGKL